MRKLSSAVVVGIALVSLLFFWSETIVLSFRTPQSGAAVRVYSANGSYGYRVVTVSPGSPAANAGLHAGDIVPANGEQTPADDLFGGIPVPRERADAVRISVERGGHRFAIVVKPHSSPYPLVDTIRVIARLLAYTVFVLLGAWVLLLRPGLMAWALFAVCLGSIAPTGDMLGTYDFYLRSGTPLYGAFTAFDLMYLALSEALPIFVLRFPNDSSPGWRGRLLPYALWFVPLIATAEAASLGIANGPAWTTVTWFAGSIVDFFSLASLAILVVAYLQSRSSDRQRLKWAVVGVAVGILAFAANSSARFVSGHSELGINIGGAFTVISVIMPICLFYAITKHRIIDVRFVLNRAIVLGVLLAIGAAVFAAIDWLFTTFVTRSQWQIALGMAIAFAVGLLIRAWFRGFVDVIDRLFFPKHNAGMRQLRELRFLVECEDSQLVQQAVTKDAAAALSLASAALFARSPDGGFIRQSYVGWELETVWHLLADDVVVQMVTSHRGRAFFMDSFAWNGMAVPTGVRQPILAVPLISRRAIVALALYAAHTSGAQVDPDEVRLLSDLCAAAAPALDQYASSGTKPVPSFGADTLRAAR